MKAAMSPGREGGEHSPARTWGRIALALCLVAILALIFWQAASTREPAYQGKSLSQWLRGYQGFGEHAPGGSAKIWTLAQGHLTWNPANINLSSQISN